MFDYPLSETKRHLYLKVWAGYFPFDDVGHCLHFIDCHFPEDKLEYALRWLIRNKITGKSFIDWFRDKCGGRNLEMHRELLKGVENERDSRCILVIKDFRL